MRFLFYINSIRGDVLKDLDWCENHPLGGSETAVLRLASALKVLGHEIEIETQIEKLTTYTTDVFVSCRDWRPFDSERLPGRLNYLWAHDDVDQKMVKPLEDQALAARVYGRCDAVIVLSHFQWLRWMRQLHLPLTKSFLSSNAVPIEHFHVNPELLHSRPKRSYYSSVPWRGLKELIELWPIVRGAVPDAELVILSSLKVYGVNDSPEWEELYDRAHNMPGIIYRGSVSQSDVRQVALSSRALAYPCVFLETSCITAMEAMAAGAVVVSTSTGALPETAWRNPLVPMAKDWGMTWAFELARVMVDNDYYVDIARQNLALSQCNSWKIVAERWLRRIRSDQVLHNYSQAA
jgi:glycosyltransferase involved in cell wall biosynthesis